jgi:hypothetical protein
MFRVAVLDVFSYLDTSNKTQPNVYQHATDVGPLRDVPPAGRMPVPTFSQWRYVPLLARSKGSTRRKTLASIFPSLHVTRHSRDCIN